MPVKINALEIENVKRIRAVSLTPKESGLTIIGGKNGQGKTSVLDAIAWALGGERYRPSNPKRDGSVIPPRLRVELSNGLVVERRGASSALTVTDATGKRSGQSLLNAFVSQLALDLPKFMQAPPREKAEILLKIIGVGDQLNVLEREEKDKYAQRTAIGRIAEQKKAYADGLPKYDGVPDEPLQAIDLIRRQQEILLKNAENAKLRRNAEILAQEKQRLEEKLDDLKNQYREICTRLSAAEESAASLEDEPTDELERAIEEIEETNRRVRANLDREHAEEDAEEYARRYNALSTEINELRAKRRDLLSGAKLPLPELSVSDGELTFRGQKWDCLSGAEQLRVASAIARAYQPECGFVLLDKLEQLDGDTLEEFGAWAQENGLQIIATRVGSEDGCTIVIEDGYEKTEDAQQVIPAQTAAWRKGTF